MLFKDRKLNREAKTIQIMIRVYCHNLHNNGTVLCNDCRELAVYAAKRLEKCPYQENKPTCKKCPIHCYSSTMKERIALVMKYAGPRMIFRHPVLALFHFLDSRSAQPSFKRFVSLDKV